MAQITVTFDKPENAPGVCDALQDFLLEVESWIEDCEGEFDRQDDLAVNTELKELLERLIGNLQE